MNRRTAATVFLVAAAIVWAFVMVLMVRNAHAATVTLSTGASCEADGISFDRKTKNVTVKCASVVVTQPPVTPPPVTVPPPVVVVPPVVVTPPAGCGSSYTLRDIGPAGQGTPLQMQEGVVYASKLPTPYGQFSMTLTTGTPGGVMIEVGISPCPGDLEYYKTPAAKYMQWGGLQAPCGSIFNPESPGLKWSNVRSTTDAPCVVAPGAYVSYRMLGGSGPMVYFRR